MWAYLSAFSSFRCAACWPERVVQINHVFVAVFQRIVSVRMTVRLFAFVPFVFVLMMFIVHVQMLVRNGLMPMHEW